MTFNIGQPVLLLQLMGEVLERPVQAIVVSDALRSVIYKYRVQVTDPTLRSDALCLVKQDWLAPAEIVIDEISDTPWE